MRKQETDEIEDSVQYWEQIIKRFSFLPLPIFKHPVPILNRITSSQLEEHCFYESTTEQMGVAACSLLLYTFLGYRSSVDFILFYQSQFIPIHIEINPLLTFSEFLQEVESTWKKMRECLASLDKIQVENLIHSAQESLIVVCFDESHFSDLNVPFFRISFDSSSHQISFQGKSIFFYSGALDYTRYFFQDIIHRFQNQSETKISDLCLPIREQDKKILEPLGVNALATSYGKVYSYIQENIKQAPDRIAIIYGENSLTYGKLDECILAAQFQLKNIGIVSGQAVAICMHRSLETLVTLLALLKMNVTYVPISPEESRERIKYFLENPDIAYLLSDQEAAARLFQGISFQKNDFFYFKSINENATRFEKPPFNIIFTSGSTGQPKGVLVSETAMLDRLLSLASYCQFSADDRFLFLTRLSFDIAVVECVLPLMLGASVVVLSETDFRLPTKINEYIRHYHVTVMQTVPAVYRLLLAGGFFYPKHLTALCGGDKIHHELVTQLVAATKRAYAMYGPTEAVVWASIFELHAEDRSLSLTNCTPLGLPLPGSGLLVLDEKKSVLPPYGFSGELYIKGILSDGYLNLSHKTEESFTNQGYRSGDLCRVLLDENNRLLIEFISRTDQQCKVRGHRIEQGEIEYYFNQHPTVKECALISIEDIRSEVQLIAFIKFKDGKENDISELTTFIQSVLPRVMWPSKIHVLEEFPLTLNGKIDRLALRSIYLSSVISFENKIWFEQLTPIQKQLVTSYNQLMAPSSVGRNLDYFQSGIDSITATQLVLQINRLYGISMGIDTLLSCTTFYELSECISLFPKTVSANPIPQFRSSNLTYRAPVSSAQHRLCLLHIMEPEIRPLYNLTSTTLLKGMIDIGKLYQAFYLLIQRQHILRTHFSQEENEFYQIVYPVEESDFILELDSMENLQSVISKFQATPFSLKSKALFRACLCSQKKDQSVLVITMHHIIMDGWSENIFRRELSVIYNSLLHDSDIPLAPLPIQYADFSVWEALQVNDEVIAQRVSYWREQLRYPRHLDFPSDRVVNDPDYSGGNARFHLSQEIMDQINILSGTHHCTQYHFFLSAFYLTLSHYSNQRDILIGSPYYDREHQDVALLIGFFVNVLLYRINLSAHQDLQMNFIQLMLFIKKITISAVQNRLSYDLLKREFSKLNIMDLPIQAVLVIEEPYKSFNFEGVVAVDEHVDQLYSRLDLILYLQTMTKGGGLSGRLEYRSTKFSAHLIERFLWSFQAAIKYILNFSQNKSIQEISFLSDIDIDELKKISGVQKKFSSSYSTVAEGFLERVRQSPTSIALYFEDENITYQQLYLRALRLSSILIEAGIVAEDRLLIYMTRSLDWLIAILATVLTGGVYVPIDPSESSDRLTFFIEDAQPFALLSQYKFSSKFEGWTGLKKFFIDDIQFNNSSLDFTFTHSTLPSQNQLAYMIYTSGSTGRPKGVSVEHQSLLNMVDNQISLLKLTAQSITLPLFSLGFDGGAVWDIWATLLAGGALFLKSGMQLMHRLVNIVESAHITHLSMTPSLLEIILKDPPLIKAFNCLSFLGIAGASLGLSLARRARELFPDFVRIYNLYGPTETTVWTTYWELTCSMDIISIGRPIFNAQLYVLDEIQQLVSFGVAGELYIGGNCLARGYFNRVDLTEKAFIHHPTLGRLYRTGDRVRYLPNGDLLFLGRIDTQAKYHGYRIEPEGIAATIQEAYSEDINQAVVLVIDSETDSKLLTFLTLNPALYQRIEEFTALRIQHWQTACDVTTALYVSTEFNITGWMNSFTEQPIERKVMQEWVKHTVSRILSHPVQDILEVGCGLGLLLLPILREAKSLQCYTATDFIQHTVDYVKALACGKQESVKLDFYVAAADELTAKISGVFDTIVLNSVIQYFPSIDYLIKVIRQAFSLLSNQGGRIFIGDVRNFDLLPAYLTEIYLYQSIDIKTQTVSDLMSALAYRISRQSELLVAPRFFMIFFQEYLKNYPYPVGIQIELKRGVLDPNNEMTNFRYDITFYVNNLNCRTYDKSEYLEYRAGFGFKNLRLQLNEVQLDQVLVIKHIPNKRLCNSASLLAALKNVSVEVNLGQFFDEFYETTEKGWDPEEVYILAEQCSKKVFITYSESSPYYFDAIFYSGDQGVVPCNALISQDCVSAPLNMPMTNNPLIYFIQEYYRRKLADSFQLLFPSYLSFHSIEVLDEFPMTTNNKIDMQRLRTYPISSQHYTMEVVEANSKLEKQLVCIWTKVLDEDMSFGINISFSNIGGNSLKFVTMVKLVEAEVKQKLDLSIITVNSTIQEIAEYIVSCEKENALKITNYLPMTLFSSSSSPMVEGMTVTLNYG